MIAVTIGAYLLTEFVELNLATLRQLFGPETPILVSDDASIRSPAIEFLAHRYGAEYECSRVRRSHFAGDAQAFVNALAFAEAHHAPLALKISQRVILLRPEVRSEIQEGFADPSIAIALPGKPTIGMLKAEQRMYSLFDYLTDVVCIRTEALGAEEFIADYRAQVATDHSSTGSYIEKLFLNYATGKFKDRTKILRTVTDHTPSTPCMFLRKCQNDQRQYREVAAALGIGGEFNLADWKRIDPAYDPRPVAV